jgi:hypothetical protein
VYLPTILISLARLPFGLEPLEISSKGLPFLFVVAASWRRFGAIEQLLSFLEILVVHILSRVEKTGAGVRQFPLQRSSSRGVHPAAT